MNKEQSKMIEFATEIQAIAQSGLAYSINEFDKQRYDSLMIIASKIMSEVSSDSFDIVKSRFCSEEGYATPKIDVRAFILKDQKLLMVKETSDDLWSLPGGWADVNESPSEAVIREVKEETGFEVYANRLLAFWDKQKHDHPPQWPHTYKCFFYCEILSGRKELNLEVSDIEFFELNDLPPVSTDRVTKKQIFNLIKLLEQDTHTAFD